MSRTILRSLVLFTSLLLAASPSSAQPVPSKAPSSTHIFPAGGRRGTTVRVRVGAECIPPGTDFVCIGQGLSHSSQLLTEIFDRGQPSPRRLPTEIPITYPRQWDAELTIPAEAGKIAYWRVSCAQGGTIGRPFVIGDLEEFIETESNSTMATAEAISLPITVNGQIHGERDIDFYQLDLEGGQLVCCEVVARRIASRLDPIITVLDASGQPVEVQREHIGDDPVIAFRAPTSGRFFLQVKNVSYHGDAAHVYRLNLTSRSFARYCYPSRAIADRRQTFVLYCLSADGELEAIEQTIDVPATINTMLQLTHPQVANTLQLPITPWEQVADDEVSQQQADATSLPVGAAVDGQLAVAADQDWFRIPVAADQAVELQLLADRRVSAALPIMDVHSSDGKRLFRSPPQLLNTGPIRYLLPLAAEAKEYLVRVRDLRRANQGGPQASYCLSAAEAAVGFSLTGRQDILNAGQDSTVSLEVSLTRQGGFKGAVEIGFENLPEGITAEATTIDDKQQKTTIKLTVPKEIPADLHLINLFAVADLDGTTVRQAVQFQHAGVDGEGISTAEPTHDQLGLVVTHQPIFRLYCSEAYLYAHRGCIFPYFMEVERLNEFKGTITLEISDRQNRDLDGIEMYQVDIADDEQSGWLPIYLPETMHINVQSQSQLYCQGKASFVDAHGKQQHILVVSEKRNMLRTLPPVVKLERPQREFTAVAGATTNCTVELNRTSNFPGSMTITLKGPHPQAVSMQPVNVEAGQTSIQLPVEISSDAEPGSQFTLSVRGEGPLDSNPAVTIVTETAIRITVADK